MQLCNSTVVFGRLMLVSNFKESAGAWSGAPWTRNGRSAETALGAPTAAVVALPMMPGPRVRGLCIGRVGEPGCEVEVLVYPRAGCMVLALWARDARAGDPNKAGGASEDI